MNENLATADGGPGGVQEPLSGTKAPDGGSFDFVVVANRLPVDRASTTDGSTQWTRSPGGLVTALLPVMHSNNGAWVGWDGKAGAGIPAFDHDGMHLEPVGMDESEVEMFYEGFSNATLWPLYHDVIARPEFHRTWWDSYKSMNQRFADRAIAVAAPGATIWVHDYQLQLVPQMIRQVRSDVRIGFFNHIPFPPVELFSQLPWRRQVIEGILGADLAGFQRPSDATNFRNAARKFLGLAQEGKELSVPGTGGNPGHTCRAEAFPISIDGSRIQELANDRRIQQKARDIRTQLGNPDKILFGVDRLDYTKGIRHRLKAFQELLNDGTLSVEDVTLIQVASPSRERVESYRQLRSEIEETVGRINGQFSTISKTAVHYLHQSYPLEEMVALYLAADVMLVTALRDGMNLVAKEYVASRVDESGVLVLSEFTGAADELHQALLVNPHDIATLKTTIAQALAMPRQESKQRMRMMRQQLKVHDVDRWANTFLESLKGMESGSPSAKEHQE